MSGNGNHGAITGATPMVYPIVGGVELVNNGNFETDPNVQWTPMNGTIASVAGGQSGNCLQVTMVSAAYQGCTQNLTTLNPLKRYRLSIWVKSGTSGNELFQFGLESGYSLQGTTSATWTYYSLIVSGLNSVASIYKMTATAGTMLFDGFSIQEVVGNEAIGWGFDGVDDYVAVANEPTFDITNYITILCWARITNPADTQCFVSKSWSAYELFCMSSTIGFQASRVGDYRALGGTTLIQNRWYQAGFRFDKDNVSSLGEYHSLFLNGNIETLSWLNGSDTNTPLATNNAVLDVGHRSASTLWLHGGLGEICVFNRALSATEIRNYYELTRRIYGV